MEPLTVRIRLANLGSCVHKLEYSFIVYFQGDDKKKGLQQYLGFYS